MLFIWFMVDSITIIRNWLITDIRLKHKREQEKISGHHPLLFSTSKNIFQYILPINTTKRTRTCGKKRYSEYSPLASGRLGASDMMELDRWPQRWRPHAGETSLCSIIRAHLYIGLVNCDDLVIFNKWLVIWRLVAETGDSIVRSIRGESPRWRTPSIRAAYSVSSDYKQWNIYLSDANESQEWASCVSRPCWEWWKDLR